MYIVFSKLFRRSFICVVENLDDAFVLAETTRPGEGFKGCLFRAQFDNIYPFKRVFQDPRPDYITIEGLFTLLHKAPSLIV